MINKDLRERPVKFKNYEMWVCSQQEGELSYVCVWKHTNEIETITGNVDIPYFLRSVKTEAGFLTEELFESKRENGVVDWFKVIANNGRSKGEYVGTYLPKNVEEGRLDSSIYIYDRQYGYTMSFSLIDFAYYCDNRGWEDVLSKKQVHELTKDELPVVKPKISEKSNTEAGILSNKLGFVSCLSNPRYKRPDGTYQAIGFRLKAVEPIDIYVPLTAAKYGDADGVNNMQAGETIDLLAEDLYNLLETPEFNGVLLGNKSMPVALKYIRIKSTGEVRRLLKYIGKEKDKRVVEQYMLVAEEKEKHWKVKPEFATLFGDMFKPKLKKYSLETIPGLYGDYCRENGIVPDKSIKWSVLRDIRWLTSTQWGSKNPEHVFDPEIEDILQEFSKDSLISIGSGIQSLVYDETAKMNGQFIADLDEESFNKWLKHVHLDSEESFINFIKEIRYTSKIDLRLNEIIKALVQIHNNWCASNRHKFTDPKRVGKQYQFLQLQYIGFEEAILDYIFIKPIIRNCGSNHSEGGLRRAYTKYQEYKNTKALLDEFNATNDVQKDAWLDSHQSKFAVLPDAHITTEAVRTIPAEAQNALGVGL